jgi:hypothetical protein
VSVIIKQKLDLTIRKYCDFAQIFHSFSWDISQCQFYSQIRDKQGNLIATFTIIHGGDAITLFLGEAITQELPVGDYLYDVMQVNENGKKSIIIEGAATVLPSRTQLP